MMFPHVGPLCLSRCIISSHGVIFGGKAELRSVTSTVTWSVCSFQDVSFFLPAWGLFFLVSLSFLERFHSTHKGLGDKRKQNSLKKKKKNE